MVKLLLVSILSAALAVSSDHALSKIDKGNFTPDEAMATSPDSISVNLPTRSINAPIMDSSDGE